VTSLSAWRPNNAPISGLSGRLDVVVAVALRNLTVAIGLYPALCLPPRRASNCDLILHATSSSSWHGAKATLELPVADSQRVTELVTRDTVQIICC
jgi:hypothetical protein